MLINWKWGALITFFAALNIETKVITNKEIHIDELQFKYGITSYCHVSYIYYSY